MGFKRDQVAELLARCHRSCCICHRFCGVKIETDHIEPAAAGGGDEIENAIPVCFNCHAEIHSYNDAHPRGRKFTSDELRLHKQQWIAACDRSSENLLSDGVPSDDAYVGPLQAMIDEIDFNLAATKMGSEARSGCPLRDDQFSRAIHTGSISILAPELKGAIINAYVAVGHASVMAQAAVARRAGGLTRSVSGTASSDPASAFRRCEELLHEAHRQLLNFVGHKAGPD